MVPRPPVPVTARAPGPPDAGIRRRGRRPARLRGVRRLLGHGGIAAVVALVAAVAPVAADPPPWLGITYQDDPMGAVVVEVHAGGAAASAGLRRDDVIVEIGGQRVVARSAAPGTLDLGKLIGRFQIGDRAPMVISRGGRRLRLAPRLRARPTADELIHQRLVGYDLPDLAVARPGAARVTADDWRGRPIVIALFDARCEPCATAVTALVDRFVVTGGDTVDRLAIEAWVLSEPDELVAFLARVPLPVIARQVDRTLGGPLLSGLALGTEGAIVVVDPEGRIRYAASTASGEVAHDGACRVATHLVEDRRDRR